MVDFTSFMTGFLEKTTETIDNRKDKADDYFEMQMEKAATIGSTSLRERREAHRQITTVSNNLMQQAGMPEDVVRGLANDGPEALEQAYKIYSQSVENGVEVNEDFWRDVYDFSTEISTDQPLSEFLAQVAGLYPSNLQATAEEGGDPFSAFVSSGLGLNAMDRARTRLETTEVEGGYSARDLLNMANAPATSRPLGDTGYTLDLQAIQDRENQVRGRTVGVPDDLDPDERIKLTETFNSRIDEKVEEAIELGHVNGESLTREDVIQEILEEQSIIWLRSAGIENLAYIKKNLPLVYNALPQEVRIAFEEGEIESLPQEEEITEPAPSNEEFPDMTPDVNEDAPVDTPAPAPTPVDGDVAPPSDEPAPAAGDRVTPQPRMIEEGEEVPDLMYEGEQLKFKEQLEDGRVVYEYPDGSVTQPMNIDDIPEDMLVYPEMPNSIPQGTGETVAPSTRPEQDPPAAIRSGNKMLTFEGYDEESQSWIYLDESNWKRVLIPAHR